MPDYFCGTCNKILARNEQRRNYETSSVSGPIIVTQLNLPHQHPLAVGAHLNRTRTQLVVRCVNCGSDALELPTKEEETKAAAKQQEQTIAVTGAVIGVILFIIFLIYLVYAATRGLT